MSMYSTGHQPVVSIHAFRGEGDRIRRCHVSRESVSIHAFRGEGDSQRAVSIFNPQYCFNPRLPGGRRQAIWSGIRGSAEFQSTPSGGKATRNLVADRLVGFVSIHAFRGEGDQFSGCGGGRLHCFNPRLPGGRRRRCAVCANYDEVFQSTPSGGKATTRYSSASIGVGFQSTPSGGKATCPHQRV